MRSLKVVEHGSNTLFESACNTLLDEGYKVIASNCFCNDDGTLYQAILVKEEE